MPPYTAHCLTLNGASNLRPAMLATKVTRLLHLTGATTDLAFSRRRNLQNRMPLHSLCITATLILHLTQAYSAITLTARPAQRSGLLTNHPFSLACLLLAARTHPQGGRRTTKAVISALPSIISSVKCTALLKDLSHFPSSNMLYVPRAKAMACNEFRKVQPRSDRRTPRRRIQVLSFHPVAHPCKQWFATHIPAGLTGHYTHRTQAVIRTALESVAAQATPTAAALLIKHFGLLMKSQQLRLGWCGSRESIGSDERLEIED